MHFGTEHEGFFLFRFVQCKQVPDQEEKTHGLFSFVEEALPFLHPGAIVSFGEIGSHLGILQCYLDIWTLFLFGCNTSGCPIVDFWMAKMPSGCHPLRSSHKRNEAAATRIHS